MRLFLNVLSPIALKFRLMGAFICYKPWDQLIARPCALAYIVVGDILGLARFRVKAEHKRYGIAAFVSNLPDDIIHIVKAICASAFMSMASPFYAV